MSGLFGNILGGILSSLGSLLGDFGTRRPPDGVMRVCPKCRLGTMRPDALGCIQCLRDGEPRCGKHIRMGDFDTTCTLHAQHGGSCVVTTSRKL